jgi:SWI/SNF-related matrix-associated actin-dependent regulator 1 of chromatin subfamily A
MGNTIPEIEAREIVTGYTGFNNQILEWKKKFETVKNYALTRPQSEYIIKYHQVEPKVARKYVQIAKHFGNKLQEDRLLMQPVEQVWIEKLLCESDKAYHIWGNINKDMKPIPMWIPKASIIQEEKKLNREIDYSPYSKRPPMSHQKEAIEKLLANDRFILADDMGLGKTTSTVIASMESGAKKVLIVCPASLKINWKREIENYTNDYVLIVEGKKWGSTYKYYIINYDILKNFHTTENSEDSEAYQIILNEGFDLAIVDEAHYISNSQAQRTQLLNDILAKIPKVWLLTGTPMTSRPINYYNLLKIVNSPLTLNWKSYVMRYCKGYQFRVGGRKVWNTSGASNLDELREQTKAVVLRRLKTDVLDLPEKIISPIWLELKNSFYDDELSDFLRISEENKEKESITVTLNRLMKLRQLIAIEKVEHTCELIDKVLEQGKKVIVFTNFTMSLDMLHEKYKKKSVVLDGRMSKIARQESVDRFQNEDKIKIFIGNIKAAGVGITLTAADTVIMNDLSFVPADHSQAEDRAYRYGQKNSVLVYYPVFENTIEMTVYNILQKKKDIIDQVMGDGEYSESFASELVKNIKK